MASLQEVDVLAQAFASTSLASGDDSEEKKEPLELRLRTALTDVTQEIVNLQKQLNPAALQEAKLEKSIEELKREIQTEAEPAEKAKLEKELKSTNRALRELRRNPPTLTAAQEAKINTQIAAAQEQQVKLEAQLAAQLQRQQSLPDQEQADDLIDTFQNLELHNSLAQSSKTFLKGMAQLVENASSMPNHAHWKTWNPFKNGCISIGLDTLLDELEKELPTEAVEELKAEWATAWQKACPESKEPAQDAPGPRPWRTWEECEKELRCLDAWKKNCLRVWQHLTVAGNDQEAHREHITFYRLAELMWYNDLQVKCGEITYPPSTIIRSVTKQSDGLLVLEGNLPYFVYESSCREAASTRVEHSIKDLTKLARLSSQSMMRRAQSKRSTKEIACVPLRSYFAHFGCDPNSSQGNDFFFKCGHVQVFHGTICVVEDAFVKLPSLHGMGPVHNTSSKEGLEKLLLVMANLVIWMNEDKHKRTVPAETVVVDPTPQKKKTTKKKDNDSEPDDDDKGSTIQGGKGGNQLFPTGGAAGGGAVDTDTLSNLCLEETWGSTSVLHLMGTSLAALQPWIVVDATCADLSYSENTGARVLSCMDRSSKQPVVLKVYDCTVNSRVRAMWSREMWAYRQVQGITGVVSIMAHVDCPEGQGLVMPLLDEVDVGKVTCSPQSFIAFLKCVVETVIEMHERGVAHCDLKPAAFMSKRDTGMPQLIDFNLARPADTAMSGVVTGTAPFSLSSWWSSTAASLDLVALAGVIGFWLELGDLGRQDADMDEYEYALARVRQLSSSWDRDPPQDRPWRRKVLLLVHLLLVRCQVSLRETWAAWYYGCWDTDGLSSLAASHDGFAMTIWEAAMVDPSRFADDSQTSGDDSDSIDLHRDDTTGDGPRTSLAEAASTTSQVDVRAQAPATSHQVDTQENRHTEQGPNSKGATCTKQQYTLSKRLPLAPLSCNQASH